MPVKCHSYVFAWKVTMTEGRGTETGPNKPNQMHSIIVVKKKEKEGRAENQESNRESRIKP